MGGRAIGIWVALLLTAACADAGGAALDLGPATAKSAGGQARGGGTRSVVVSPRELSLEVGESAALTVAIRDRKGEVPDDQAAWASSDPSVATVDGTGVVTAVGPGSAAVVATWRNVADTALVGVAGAPSPPPPDPAGIVRECDAPRPEWIWCDDFESNRLAAYFEWNDKGGSFVRAAEVGLDGSSGMRASWVAGQVAAGWMHVAFGRTPSGYFAPVDAGDRDYREIYWRFFSRYDADWTGGGGSKMSRAHVFHSAEGWQRAMQAHLWSGDPPPTDVLALDPTTYVDAAGAVTDSPRWLGHRTGTAPIFADGNVGPWHCIEARVRLNDAGAANGVFQVWVDGDLDAEATGLDWVGSYDDFGINVVTLDNYWNAGAPKAQSRYFDNLVVSTAPVGCG